ncbi:MAG: mechanosensitive ion channel [Planctomycetes bacterium]|nr:mechanosensitive ion channel [Planctomycetota bacterium]
MKLLAVLLQLIPDTTGTSNTDGSKHAWWQDLTFKNLILLVAVIFIAWVVSQLVQSALTRTFKRRKSADHGGQIVVKRLAHYLIMGAGVFLGLNLAEFPLTSLFAAGAVFAVVIGFALQNLSENFVAGLILMIERSITPGDVLEVEARVVRVLKMGIRATVARTRDDEDIIIPNSLLVTSTVKNFTLRDSLYRLRATIGVAYSSDMKLVRRVLEETSDGFPERHASKEPRILLTGFGSSSVDWEVSVWIEDPWHSRWMHSKLNEAIWHALRQAGVTIAFPQLDLHVDPELLAALRATPPAGS